jgi:hypothetical protein
VKQYIQRAFTGDKRGEALALGAPTEAQLLQYNMQGFDVGPIRDVSEERVCAAIGIPAAVVGFGTGLQQTKVGATMKEMRQLAWISGVIPLAAHRRQRDPAIAAAGIRPRSEAAAPIGSDSICRGAAAVGDAEARSTRGSAKTSRRR